MKDEVVGLGQLVIWILLSILILPFVYMDQEEPQPRQNAEDSDGDHDRLKDRSHPNADVMNGVGGYSENDPARKEVGSD